jgi:hypothetical protein
MKLINPRVKTEWGLTKQAYDACLRAGVPVASIDPSLAQEMRDAAGALGDIPNKERMMVIYESYQSVKGCQQYLALRF